MSESETQTRPVISLAISLKTESDRAHLLQALSDIAQQDRSARIQAQSDGQIILNGIDELHLESICDSILHQYKIEIDMGEPRVIYLETISKPAEAEGKYIRHVAGSGNYAHIKISIEPNERSRGLEFRNDIQTPGFPKNYIESTEMGIREALHHGIIAGHELVDVKVRLIDGSYHDTDSNEVAFSIAGSLAINEAARKASPMVLEPFMSVTVATNKITWAATSPI